MKPFYLLIIGAIAYSQTSAQYTFSTFVENFSTHVFATEIVENDYDDDSIWDNPEFELDFGFSFPVIDQFYTGLAQDGDGALLELTNGESTTFFAYSSDLIDGELENPLSPSIISYITVGDIGSRIFKIQYENCGFYNVVSGLVAGEISNRVNFQIWFYETGIFEMRFGPHSITDNQLAHDGPGPTIFLAAIANLSTEEAEYLAAITGDPSNPTLLVNPPIKGTPPILEGNPSNGRVYRFTPNSVGLKDEISISNLKLYPSQADQFIYIEGHESPNARYHIVDITGKTQQTGLTNQGESIDVSTMPEGLYLLNIAGFTGALKFVKRN